MSRRKPPELKVVLDTSAIFMGSASDLLRAEVVEAIRANARFPDLTVTWHLPEVVLQERQYQMLRRALELLPSIEKLERLIGHGIAITEEVLRTRVEETIKRQVSDLGLSVCRLDPQRVDWPAVIRSAAFREPPFEPGDKEKGFRDAIVAETIQQLLVDSPVTPTVCRVAVITGDKLLSVTLRERTKDLANARVLETLEELTGLINTLVADVDEAFVARLLPKAQKCFFVPQDETTFYFTQKIGDRLRAQFATELETLPAGATARRNTKWLIAAPRFVRKERQRVFWTTRVTVHATALASSPEVKRSYLELETSLPTASYEAFMGTKSDWAKALGGMQPITAQVYSTPSTGYLSQLFAEQKEVAKGQTVFEVDWSVSVGTSLSLTKPRLEGLRFVETAWE